MLHNYVNHFFEVVERKGRQFAGPLSLTLRDVWEGRSLPMSRVVWVLKGNKFPP